MRAIILMLATMLLAGCASDKLMTTIPGGEAKVFEAPPYEVRGVTRYDQNWIDSQVEGGVAAFNWPRPAPRPPEIEKSRPLKVAPAPVKKKGFVRRIKDRVSNKVWPTTSAAPVVATPAPPPPLAAAADPSPPAPPAAPRDPVDELLDPTPMPNLRLVR